MRDEILDLKNARRIAVMGGTFDPIHYGHLVTAEAVRQEYNIEKVIFIPAGKPAHKTGIDVTHSEHRYLMTVLATVNNPFFGVSRMEIDRKGITYTIDTIGKLSEVCGDRTKIYFITGADAVNDILSWKDSDTLLTLCSFIAVTRPGYNTESLREKVAAIKEKYQSRLHFLEVPALAISSSNIRERAQKGKTIKYLLPEEVEKYIYKHNLYGSAELTALVADEIRKKLKTVLTPKRFLHVKGVEEEAVKLGEFYGADQETLEKIRLAALLHDCGKCLGDGEMKELCRKNGIKLTGIFKKDVNAAHCYAGEILARNEYGISDPEILAGVRNHTFGRPGMGLIEKIICVADYIEPNRKDYDGLEEIRAAAYSDLDQALQLRIEKAIAYCVAKGAEPYKGSVETLEWIKSINETKQGEN